MNKKENLKWERDYYKLRFEELNKHWHNITDTILGEKYYNYGCSWDDCDDLTEEDLIYAYNHTSYFKRFIKKCKKKIINLLEE